MQGSSNHSFRQVSYKRTLVLYAARMRLRAELQSIVEELLQRPGAELSLDEIAEAVGATAISFDEIETIFVQLEAANRAVTGASVTPTESLTRVLTAAKMLRSELGRTPNSVEVASRAGLNLASVHLALLFARTLQR